MHFFALPLHLNALANDEEILRVRRLRGTACFPAIICRILRAISKESEGGFMRHFIPTASQSSACRTGLPTSQKDIVGNLFRFGFRGDVFPMGNNGGEIFGKPFLPTWHSWKRPPTSPSCSSPPRRYRPYSMRVGGRGPVTSSLNLPDSPSSVKTKGARRGILAVASTWGIMFQGPNCFGVMNMENGVILPFFALDPGS